MHVRVFEGERGYLFVHRQVLEGERGYLFMHIRVFEGELSYLFVHIRVFEGERGYLFVHIQVFRTVLNEANTALRDGACPRLPSIFCTYLLSGSVPNYQICIIVPIEK